MMDRVSIALALVCALGSCKPTPPAPKPAPTPTSGLRKPADFAAITDDAERSVALLQEAAKVIQHPRCVNCHPAGDRPLQGDGEPHQPFAVRGEDAHGAPGMTCTTCHGESSYLNMPGSPDWHLAPREMAWEGKSLGAICAQMKDEKRNGGMSLSALADHMANDALVAYGWKPPEHLEPAPGDQPTFALLIRAWIDAGAVCPPE